MAAPGEPTPLPEYVSPPLQTAAGQNTTVRKFTATTTSKNDQLPAAFVGRYCALTAIGADIDWFLSPSNVAAADATLAAADDGAPDPTNGSRLLNGVTIYRVLQLPDDSSPVYLVRESNNDAGILQVELA